MSIHRIHQKLSIQHKYHCVFSTATHRICGRATFPPFEIFIGTFALESKRRANIKSFAFWSGRSQREYHHIWCSLRPAQLDFTSGSLCFYGRPILALHQRRRRLFWCAAAATNVPETCTSKCN
jgi:hypothetical protein